jgi:hypothetical protein
MPSEPKSSEIASGIAFVSDQDLEASTPAPAG